MSDAQSGLWDGLARLLRGADVAGVRANKVGAVAARLRRQHGEPVPPELASDERGAAIAMTLARPLLEHIRSLVDGPILVIKGPEVARLYPGSARSFGDLDLLVPDAERVQRVLVAAGYVEIDDPDVFRTHHHLRPLQPPAGSLKVEIHRGLFWPRSARPPTVKALVERAVASRVGVDGISAPAPVDHALILAAHAWSHEPLRILRDLVDLGAVVGLCTDDELDAAAAEASIARLWATTRAAMRTLFDDEPPSMPLRIWARHLPPVRERTVFESHVTRWLHPFWELPPHRAVLDLRRALRALVLPDPRDTWGDKLRHVRHGLLNPRARMSKHLRSADRDRR